MSDWWYPGQLARQDQYGNRLPDDEWPAVQMPPEQPLAPDERGLQPQTATIGPAEMRSYQPTLGERIKGGLSDLFRSAGADPYNAGKLGDIATTGLSMFPPIGIPVAKSEMEHGVEARSPGGVVMGALGAIPGVKPGVLGDIAKPFYSAAGRAVENAKLGKGTGEQWLGYLRNQPGVKPEELQYVFGNLPEGQLTKAQMQAHAAENAVTLGEKSLGDNTQLQMKLAQDVIKEKAQLQRLGNEWDAAQPSARTQIETEMNLRHDRIRELENESAGLPARNSKYDQWQLPGGENYRETLLTLPGRKGWRSTNGEWFSPDDIANPVIASTLKKVGGGPSEEVLFKSSHWDEPNVLAHVRTNDREIPGVGKSLHVEEIQSDWHQKGRTQGYRGDDAALNPLKEKADAALAASRADPNNASLLQARDDAQRELYKAIGGVPDAPFKSTWADVALKRQIREASEKGYDAISWTPGEAQAARYDLSKQVNQLDLTHNRDGAGELIMTLKDGRKQNVPITSKENLADTVGKDMAEKLYKQGLENNGKASLAGVDLKIGGEGMKAFYDKMLVDKANAIGKKHGARVEQTDMFEGSPGKWKPVQGDDGRWHLRHTEDGFDASLTFPTREAAMAMMDEGKKHAVHVLRITPELRAAAMKGFPLFTAGGAAVIGGLAATDEAEAGGIGNILKAGRDPLWSPLSLQKLSEPLDMAAHQFKDVRVPVPKIVDPAKLVGGYGVFPPWDLSATNRTATHINDVRLQRPVVAQGGMGFPEANPGLGLASTQGAAQAFETQMGRLAETGKPVYIMPQTMTPQTLDASHHVAEPLGQLVKQAPIPRASVVEFNDMMRDKLAAQHARAVESAREAGRAIPDKPPPWVSIKNDKFDEYLNSLDMGSKSNIAQIMAKREWQDKGFPNVAGIRHAMSDLGLVDLPSNTIGATVSRYTPGKGLIDTTHADYPKGIAAEYMGQLATLVPHEVGAPDIAKALAQRNEENFARGAKSVLTPTRHAMMPTKGLPSAQYFDDEWLDSYMKYVNRGR